jgi:diguanylate cyclase (GGDEF)-like protein
MGPVQVLRIVLFVIIMNCAAATAEQLTGMPPHSRFSPPQDAFPEQYGLVQDGEGLLYLANVGGVLIHDGARWTNIELPNRQLVRSLAYDGKDRVYVGGYDQFGFIQKDATGREVYHDLTHGVPDTLRREGFDDIWNVLVSPEGVFFRGLWHVFRYLPEDGSLRVWNWEQRFGAISWHQGSVWLQFRGEGLRRLVGDEFEPVEGSESLTELIYALVPLPQGGQLMLGTTGGWEIFSEGRVEPARVPNDMPATTEFSRHAMLADGRIALGSVDGWLYVLDLANGSAEKYRFSRNWVGGVIEDRHGGLILVTDLELIHISWPAPWSVLAAESGLSSGVHAIRRWNQDVYTLSTSGVLVSRDGSRTFLPLDWTPFEAWDLLPLDQSQALLAETYAIYLVDDRGAKAISEEDLYPRVLMPSLGDPRVIYVGTEMGHAVLRQTDSEWEVLHHQNQFGAAESLAEESPGVIWIGTSDNGLWRVRHDQAFIPVSEEAIDETLGIEYGSRRSAFVFSAGDGELLVATEAGIHVWTGDRFEPDRSDSARQKARSNEQLIGLQQDNKGGLWAMSYNHIYYRDADRNWREFEIGGVLRGALNAVTVIDDQPWFGASDSIIRFQQESPLSNSHEPSVRLSSVVFSRPGTPGQFLDPTVGTRFESGEFSLQFNYALPDFQRLDAIRYRARLHGFERDWQWGESRSAIYSALEPGDYRFELQGRDSLGNISAAASYHFSINPPWYASQPAKVIWLLALVSLVSGLTWVLQRYRMQRLREYSQELKSMVRERTRELESANQRLDAMAHLDGLTGIANRRRLEVYMEAMWSQCQNQGRPLAVLMVDVDQFKQFNDLRGHLAGDPLLVQLASELSACLRRGEDLVARYGGEEFLVVLPGADLDTAMSQAERMRQRIEQQSVGATISIGVAIDWPGTNDGFEALIGRADQALYRAKSAGRNRVEADE